MSDTQILYSNADLERALTRKVLREGWYKAVVTNASEKQASSAKGTLFTELTLNLMDAQGSPTKFTVKHRLWMPFANPEVAGHTAPNTIGICASYLQATSPKAYPQLPYKDGMGPDGRPQYFDPATGEHSSSEIYSRRQRELYANTLAEMNKRLFDPQRYFGDEAYILVNLVQGNGDSKFPNIKKFSAELPANAELITENFLVTPEVDAAE